MADETAAEGQCDTAWWCTQSEAARRLRVNRKTLYRMVRTGQPRTFRLGGRDLVRLSDLEEYQRRGAE